MESIETELYGEYGKRDDRGRQLLGENEWYRLLSEYDASGLTQKVFCKREGVKYGTFVAWLGRRKKKRESGEEVVAQPKFHSLGNLGDITGGGSKLEVQLPDGIVWRGENPRDLSRLVLLLRG
jgi:hypothetical protein